ncbi:MULTISPECIES: hypothetical protein [unclassified Arthrobacter]|uniref:hypothetical protein n=1 Tax=unclassified Arthrobacter TaxID=235627 RepID=UPI001C863A5B|nr:hypothetical protein [Arthrobacter sp. MAHUQ-56]MBX7445434.1 hypothetical protein [Arthrobacter sp. MAHUQ-56]
MILAIHAATDLAFSSRRSKSKARAVLYRPQAMERLGDSSGLSADQRKPYTLTYNGLNGFPTRQKWPLKGELV